ncbi:hypothetical protein BLA29_004010 [Euroglyphus maynei]|uniref:BTB domain-containing protein n=1 Tax=Euroglyphus maynei TaxID=6958 RepID=A0A1Y3AUD1_EURMA|nr:hypothetical protein BLA29_004010 [Euroglyphus maynei]
MEIVDIKLFQDVFYQIDQDFLKSIISIVNSTFAYGPEICRILSLKYDPSKPQQISMLNDKKIIQVDSGHSFVVILTDDGKVYLINENTNWQTLNTFTLISNDDQFKMIAHEDSNLLLLRQDGIIFTIDSSLQLIPIIYTDYCTRKTVDIKNVKLIACGNHTNFALTNGQKLYAFFKEKKYIASNLDKKNEYFTRFVPFYNDSPIKKIIAENNFSLFLLENGHLYFQRSSYFTKDFTEDFSMKLIFEEVKRIAYSKYCPFILVYCKSSYYKLDKSVNPDLSEKFNFKNESLASIIIKLSPKPLTYGMIGTFYSNEYERPHFIRNESMLRLFNNIDNHDIEFIIGDKRICASKCHLKSVSEYFRKMLSGKWRENDSIIITSYSYDTYYSYLSMLHGDSIKIDDENLTEFFDLAHCYIDQQLLQYCKCYIQNEINEQTLSTYLPIIIKYQLNELNGKLRQITHDKILPKIQNNIQKNDNSVQKFLEFFLDYNESLSESE